MIKSTKDENVIDNFEVRGWDLAGPRTYRHHSGAKAVKRGLLWIPKTVAGISLAPQSTFYDAMAHIEKHDPDFWSYGQLSSLGPILGGWMNIGRLEDRQLFVCRFRTLSRLNAFRDSSARKYFIDKARCDRCGGPMAQFSGRVLQEFEGPYRRRGFYVVCRCNHPV